MKLNEKNVASFAVCSSPIDKEGYLSKRGSLNQSYQRRWFVLKGNLLFYFEKKRDREPVGVIILEHCSVQASEFEKHALEISFDGINTRTYVLLADHETDMTAWIRAISHASYEYLKSIVQELQERLDGLMMSRKSSADLGQGMQRMHVSPQKRPVERVVNGHLMDIEEDDDSEPAPKIPVKNRHTVYAPRSECTDEDAPLPGRTIRSHTPDELTFFQHPHASPLDQDFHFAPHGSSVLSPKTSFDATPCLLPEKNTLPLKSDLPLIDFGTIPSQPLGGPRSLTPPPLPTKQKSFEEMHGDLHSAMKTLGRDS